VTFCFLFRNHIKLINFFSFSLTCNLIIPKQVVEGIISIDVKPKHELMIGDTSISGSIELPEKLNVYVNIFIVN